MFTKKHYINVISVLILLFVNIKFLIDYSSSRGFSPVILNIVFVILFFGVVYIQDRIFKPDEQIVNKNFVYMVLVLILASLAFDFAVNSNRGSSYFTAFNWLVNMGNGVYPYNNNSYSYNLPFLYYLDAPFYLMGDVRIIGLFGLALFLLLLPGYSFNKKELVIRTSTLLLLPLVYYEITVGGDALANIVVAIIIIFLMNKFLDPDKIDIRFIFLSILFGIILCTRVLVLIPFILSVLFFFRYNFKNLFLFILISLLICFSVLVPFIKWDYISFATFGPFTNNLATLSVWVYVILFIVIVYAGWMISDLQELLFASGVILFFVSIILGKNEADISEMVIAIPFLILSINEYRIDKFTGKQISIR
jgi:hypothetical protein